MTNGNILLPEGGPARRSCEWCHARMHVIDAFYVCPSCGQSKAVESKPESRLASVEDGSAMIVQSNFSLDATDVVIPDGAQVIQEIDVASGAETTIRKRINSQSRSADVTIFL